MAIRHIYIAKVGDDTKIDTIDSSLGDAIKFMNDGIANAYTIVIARLTQGNPDGETYFERTTLLW